MGREEKGARRERGEREKVQGWKEGEVQEKQGKRFKVREESEEQTKRVSNIISQKLEVIRKLTYNHNTA